MPEILINSLRAKGMPTVLRVFEWDGFDDEGIVAFIEKVRTNDTVRDFEVDRSNPNGPELKAQKYAIDNSDPNVPYEERPWIGTGEWRSIPLHVNAWIVAEDFYSSWFPIVWDDRSYFKCDEHGRAYSISDLVVP